MEGTERKTAIRCRGECGDVTSCEETVRRPTHNLILKRIGGLEKWKTALSDLLIRCAAHGHVSSTKMILKNGRIEPTYLANRADHYGQASLYKAAFHGHLEVCRLLVKAGAEFDLASTDTGATPLAVASQNGHYA